MKNIALCLCISFLCMNGMEADILQKKSTNSWCAEYEGHTINLIELSLDNFKMYHKQENISSFITRSYHEKEHPMSTKFYAHTFPTNKSICSFFNYSRDEMAQEVDNQLLDLRYHFITEKKSPVSNKSIKRSSKKLDKLYKGILYEDLQKIPNYNSPKLLSSTLHINLRFSETQLIRSAIQTIFKLIRTKPNIYCTINFFANDPINFAWHKTVLFEQTGLLHRICLFYWMHKNHDNLSQLPEEIRDYIVKLIMFN